MNKVQTGDPIQIKAATWNSFIDAAEYVKNLQSDQRGGPLSNGNYSGVILLKNGESTLFPRFSAMAITDVLRTGIYREVSGVSRSKGDQRL